jgi:signal transduction histidine kinase
MSLRLKIVLGIIVVPVLTAVALLVLMEVALSRTADDIKQQSASVQSALQDKRELWNLALKQRDDQLVATWIDANLSAATEMDAMRTVLPRQELFRSAVAFETESIQSWNAPLVPLTAKAPADDDFHPGERERGLCLNALQSFAAERVHSADGRVLRSTPVVDGNFYYWPLLEPGGDFRTRQPRIVLRLELERIPISLPAFDGPKLDFSTLTDAATRTLAVGVVLMLIVLLVSVRLLVTKPLEQLVAASQRVAEGDFSRPVPLPGGRTPVPGADPAKAGDEIARLITAFNLMQEEVRRFREGLERQIEQARAQIREQERSLMVAQRLAATGTLAAGLAHEINTPLGGMQNAVRRLRKQAAERPAGADEKTAAYYDLLEEGLTRIESLMRQVLDFSRRRDTEPQVFDVAEAARRAAELVKFRFEGAAKLTLELDADTPRVFGDPAAIGQVVTNLLLNARDALPSGSGEVTLRVRTAVPAAQPGKRAAHSPQPAAAEIIVTDTGSGMSPDTVQRIFDPFFTTKEAGKGTGLGLAIVHTVVQNHGGTIRVESEPTKGTTFTVTLPAAPAES